MIYAGPVLIAALVGWTCAKSPPQRVAEALRALAWALLVSCAWISLFLLAWVGLVTTAAGAFNLTEPFLWVAQTAIFWVPVAVITFIIRAQKERVS